MNETILNSDVEQIKTKLKADIETISKLHGHQELLQFIDEIKTMVKLGFGLERQLKLLKDAGAVKKLSINSYKKFLLSNRLTSIKKNKLNHKERPKA